MKSECEEREFELFKRRCIETVEASAISPSGEFRIMYSLHYADQSNMVIVSIAGAPTSEWDRTSSTFDAMSRFELIDMSRFPQAPEK